MSNSIAIGLEVRDVRLPECGHPVTGFLAEVGLLQRAVLEAAEGALDRAAFERDALEMRERAPQYYLTLAQRPGPAQKKLELMRRAHELFAGDVGYITRYAEALAMAGRDGEAIARFDEAMGIEPDHLTVLLRACEFTALRQRLPAARAIADWLSRLHPGAAPIETLRARLSRPRLAMRRSACASGALSYPASAADRRRFWAQRRRPLACGSRPRLRARPFARAGLAADDQFLAAARRYDRRRPERSRRYRPHRQLAGASMAGETLVR